MFNLATPSLRALLPASCYFRHYIASGSSVSVAVSLSPSVNVVSTASDPNNIFSFPFPISPVFRIQPGNLKISLPLALEVVSAFLPTKAPCLTVAVTMTPAGMVLVGRTAGTGKVGVPEVTETVTVTATAMVLGGPAGAEVL